MLVSEKKTSDDNDNDNNNNNNNDVYGYLRRRPRAARVVERGIGNQLVKRIFPGFLQQQCSLLIEAEGMLLSGPD